MEGKQRREKRKVSITIHFSLVLVLVIPQGESLGREDDPRL